MGQRSAASARVSAKVSVPGNEECNCCKKGNSDQRSYNDTGNGTARKTCTTNKKPFNSNQLNQPEKKYGKT
jgi:hypothetical protein